MRHNSDEPKQYVPSLKSALRVLVSVDDSLCDYILLLSLVAADIYLSGCDSK